MSIGLAFWVIYLVAFILSLVYGRPFGLGSASGLLTFVLLGLLGWSEFGAPVR